MRVPFTAFADDSVIHGELLLEGDRLSDFIPQDDPFEIDHVRLEALDDGRTVEVAAAAIARADLIAITGSGPRGNPARRIRTRPQPARIQAGPYEIVGYVHSPPGGHPFNRVLGRRVLPVTSALIRYERAGQTVDVAYETLLVNPTRMDWLEAATDEDVRLAKAVELPFQADPHAKDMTGELLV